MSVTLNNADLTSAAVGKTGSISLASISGGGGVPFQQGDKATIRLHNDSGAGLRITLPKSSQQFNLPAGGWADCYPAQGETQIAYLVLYLLPDPPVSLLMGTYFFPGEDVPPMTILGNSPVGIGGTVNTSSVQTLSNEGNSAATLVIDIGDSSLTQLLKIFASGQALWKVDQSGVAHQIFNIQVTGTPLQIGQAGDIVEVLGKLNVDQLLTAGAGITVSASGITISAGGLSVTGGTSTDSLNTSGNASVGGTLTVTGDATLNGAGTGLTVTNNESVGGTLAVTGSSSLDNGTITTDGTGNIILANNNRYEGKDTGGTAHAMLYADTNNDTVVRAIGSNGVQVQDSSAGLIATFTSGQFAIASGGKLQFEDGSHLKDLHAFTGTGSGNFNTNCPSTPDMISFDPCTASGSSQTIGGTLATTTHVTTGASLAWNGTAIVHG